MKSFLSIRNIAAAGSRQYSVPRHLTKISDFSPAELTATLDTAADMKINPASYHDTMKVLTELSLCTVGAVSDCLTLSGSVSIKSITARCLPRVHSIVCWSVLTERSS